MRTEKRKKGGRIPKRDPAVYRYSLRFSKVCIPESTLLRCAFLCAESGQDTGGLLHQTVRFSRSVSDNFDERIEQKIFHAEIVVDNEKVAAETKAYKPIPIITYFTDENGKDCMRDMIHSNYKRIKDKVKQIVKDELARIANDENLSHLLQLFFGQ